MGPEDLNAGLSKAMTRIIGYFLVILKKNKNARKSEIIKRIFMFYVLLESP
jgi:hypothetical protein